MKIVILNSLLILLILFFVSGSDIYHGNTKLIFRPDMPSQFFGYSVLLNAYGLIVGAPKAKSRLRPSISPGLVFNCSLHDLDVERNVTCIPIASQNPGLPKAGHRYMIPETFFMDDMFFGATLAALNDEVTLICAPKWQHYFNYTSVETYYFMRPIGACSLYQQNRERPLYPLDRDLLKQWVSYYHIRKNDGLNITSMWYYANGISGMSAKASINNTVIIGAPGILEYSGGNIIYDYSFNAGVLSFSKKPISNPCNNLELFPFAYFGYSVDSGVFEQNGHLLYVGGAPRSKQGHGQVFIFEAAVTEKDPLKMRAQIDGPHLGSYFGSSVCCTDIDGDGRSDLLVGAPTFAKQDIDLQYDQGAVFIYMSREQPNGFILESSGYVTGRSDRGARFGTAIADLGDIDGDGYKDVAIGAPWEDEGSGAVYIYRGGVKGLQKDYVQRIQAEGSRSFGFSIAQGYDVDRNKCNDLIVGAHNSEAVYLYRCVPSMIVVTSINVPSSMNLPLNTTGFMAQFCVTAPENPWPMLQIDLQAKITIDPEKNRAKLVGESEYNITVQPGNKICSNKTIEVEAKADLSKPITIKFELVPMELMRQDSSKFLMNAVRLSEDSKLRSSVSFNFIRDCGADMVCNPLLVMTLEALANPYTPGSDTKFGIKVTVLNKNDPGFNIVVKIAFQFLPVAVPRDCMLHGLTNDVIICDIPALLRHENVTWNIELEYKYKAVKDITSTIEATLQHNGNETVADLDINITPRVNLGISGKSLPNATLFITRETYDVSKYISFQHSFEVTNFGPSDWYDMNAEIFLPSQVTLISPVQGCNGGHSNINCTWTVRAKESLPVDLHLRFDFIKYGDILNKEVALNVTTKIIILSLDKKGQTFSDITTTLVLNPASPIWPIIVGLVAGLLVLAVIIIGLHKADFFSRKEKKKLMLLQENKPEVMNVAEVQSGADDPHGTDTELQATTSSAEPQDDSDDIIEN